MRILGIDPGTNATGYGVVERNGSRLAHVAHGVIRPERAQSMAARLAEIHAGVAELIALHEPSCVVIEQIFVAASGRSAIVLGQARGVALAAIGAARLPFDEISPQQIKLAVTGTGVAEKFQVQAMVQRLLALAALPARDAADALAAAICGAQMQGSRLYHAALGANRANGGPRGGLQVPIDRSSRSRKPASNDEVVAAGAQRGGVFEAERSSRKLGAERSSQRT